MSQSWARLTHKFSVGGHAGSTAHSVHPNARCSRAYLAQHLVDCLVVDRGELHKPRPAEIDEQGTFWELLIINTPAKDRPLLVVEFWESASALWAHGPSAKLTTTRWTKLGYTSRCKVVASDTVGGAITQARLVIARYRSATNLNWEWAPMPPPRSTTTHGRSLIHISEPTRPYQTTNAAVCLKKKKYTTQKIKL